MKLHLGCGDKYIDGFVHIDLQEFDHIDYQESITDLHFIDDNSVELIYACHVLEHIGRNDYEDVLREWYRVLKPNGILRVSVPSFDAVVDYYTNIDDDITYLLGFLVGGQKNEYDHHYMVFTKRLLYSVLLSVGFVGVCEYDWSDTEHSDVDDYSQAYLPHMDKDCGMLMSLNVEAIK